MRRSTALKLLSPAHAQILELAEQGLGRDEVAVRLNVDPTAVEPLLRIARAKLAALTAQDAPTDGALHHDCDD